jgi:hypothetical protein
MTSDSRVQRLFLDMVAEHKARLTPESPKSRS